MLLSSLVAVSHQVAATSGRNAKVSLLADLLKTAQPEEIEIAISFLSGSVRQAKLGIGYAGLNAARSDQAAAEPSLTLRDVDEQLERLPGMAGKGSARTKAQLLKHLLGRATAEEQDFLVRLAIGELRQGALEGLMSDAVAKAAGIEPAHVRRAAMLSGDLAAVAQAVLTRSVPGLAIFDIQLFRPLQPMLAQSAADVSDALEQIGAAAAFEYKLDGARIQVHKKGDEVRVFSRLLNDVTAAVGEVVEVVKGLPWREVILDGEAIALKADGRPQPFQVTMSQFSSRLTPGRGPGDLPLSAFFFDILYADGASLLDAPYARRSDVMGTHLPRPPRLVTQDPAAARAFLDAALAAGHEGVMAKALAAPYEAGARGSAWIKIKPANTLDLVVLAAEWGHGRRQGKLSNLHLGARDPESGGFVMLGKTFKGMTDALLEWQTRELLARKVKQEGHIVFVRPELVVEVAFNGLQASTTYPGGLALRFARIVRYREDKNAELADTIGTVRDLHRKAG
jgi:DNA ligase-1